MFTSHGVLFLHALDALLSTSLVVVVTAASDGMRFSAIYALLVGLLQLIRVGCVCWCYWRLRRGETAVDAVGNGVVLHQRKLVAAACQVEWSLSIVVYSALLRSCQGHPDWVWQFLEETL
ncbi:unnamed protein product [Symbiodinium sp. CCMP2592]|nr:unnamed protein product [Symbiodinium sp. CCMP2592]